MRQPGAQLQPGMRRAGGVWSPRRRDAAFRWTAGSCAAATLILCVAVGVVLHHGAALSIERFHASFIWSRTWDPVNQVFGALPFIYGTLVSSFLALMIAGPVSIGAAIFLAEIAPPWTRSTLSFVVELLAAIPSVIYGLWGIFVLVPMVRKLELWLGAHFSFVPLFRGFPYGIGMLSGALILAIMVTPIVTSVSREVLLAVPDSAREASYALGGTQWETIFGPVLAFGRPGIVGALLLGLGRALGETMAVTMVIGNRPEISASLFAPSYTMASVLANEFTEATYDLYVSALIEIGLLLFALTIAVNAGSRWLLWKVSQSAAPAVRG